MEAKDTVDKYLEEMGWLISKDSMQYAWLIQLVEISLKAGIKEVAEWLDDSIISLDNCLVLDISKNQWQTKLEEWGIE